MVAAQALDDPLLPLGYDAYTLEDSDQDENGECADDNEAGHDASFLLMRSGPDDPGSIAFDGDKTYTLA
ncbi:hypothetical protein D3C81_1868860 [compost metagenome]